MTISPAAITSLAKFGASCEDLLPSVLVLLDRCLMDNDDEVRDRALLYLQVLRQKQKALSSAYILNRNAQLVACGCGFGWVWFQLCCVVFCTESLYVVSFVWVWFHLALSVSVKGLERALMQYCAQPSEEPFDMKTVPIDTAPRRDKMQCKYTPSKH